MVLFPRKPVTNFALSLGGDTLDMCFYDSVMGRDAVCLIYTVTDSQLKEAFSFEKLVCF